MITSRRVTFTALREAALQPFQVTEPGEAEVLVETERTLMSIGTEGIVYSRSFAPGTHWDNWVKYPFYPGYCAVGRVIAAGSAAKVQVGQRVALRGGHAAHHVVAEDKVFPVPDGIDPAVASWFALAKIAFMGALKAEFALGDQVLVIGAGPIGQMALRWAVAAGASRVSVVDTAAHRLETARLGGATLTIAKPIDAAMEELRAHHGGQLPRVVIDSTGNAAVFAHALAAVRDYGRVVLLGDTGRPAEQHLTSDLITRGLQVVGAHDIHNNAQWNDRTITELFFSLVQSGRFRLDGLNTDTFAPEACADAYAATETRRAGMLGVVFNWRTAA